MRCRIGIAVGTVLCGVLGRLQPRFHVFGHGIRAAEKLEQTGTPDAVHASDGFVEALADNMDTGCTVLSTGATRSGGHRNSIGNGVIGGSGEYSVWGPSHPSGWRVVGSLEHFDCIAPKKQDKSLPMYSSDPLISSIVNDNRQDFYKAEDLVRSFHDDICKPGFSESTILSPLVTARLPNPEVIDHAVSQRARLPPSSRKNADGTYVGMGHPIHADLSIKLQKQLAADLCVEAASKEIKNWQSYILSPDLPPFSAGTCLAAESNNVSYAIPICSDADLGQKANSEQPDNAEARDGLGILADLEDDMYMSFRHQK